MTFTPLTTLNNVDPATFNAVFAQLDSTRPKMQSGGIIGFRVDATNTLAVSISAGVARDDTDTVDIKRTTAAGAISLAGLSSGTGANKLDTGALAANTWYYAYVIAKTDGTVAGLLSLSASAPTMPTGYVYKRRVGMVRTNSSAVLHRQTTLDDGLTRQVVYVENTTTGDFLVSNGVDVSHASWDTISMASIVPPSARLAKVMLAVSIATANIQLYYRIASSMTARLLYQGSAAERFSINMDLPVTSSQAIEIKASASATETLTLMVQGYVDNLACAIV